ncbi:MAG: hypothetical protein WBO54_02225 [Thermoanaerobaculia bacterium]
MTISEPITMVTDYLVTLLAASLGIHLIIEGRARSCRAEALWGWAFMATALGALAGGTSHGFVQQLGDEGWQNLWKVTVYAIGAASFLLLAGALVASFSGPWRRLLLLVAFFKLLGYLWWMASHDDFRFVINDYGSTMLLVLLLQIWQWWARRDPSAPWVVGGILVSFGASLIQQSGFALHQHFNHNDIFHVIQLLALWLLYRGGRLLNDGG